MQSFLLPPTFAILKIAKAFFITKKTKIMKNNISIFLAILLLIFSACSTQKQVAPQDIPDLVIHNALVTTQVKKRKR